MYMYIYVYIICVYITYICIYNKYIINILIIYIIHTYIYKSDNSEEGCVRSV